MDPKTIPSISVAYTGSGASTRSNAMGMRPMQERVYQKRGEHLVCPRLP